MDLALTHDHVPADPGSGSGSAESALRRNPEHPSAQLGLPGVAAESPSPSPRTSTPWLGDALAGRIVELSGATGRTSTAVSMVLAKQREGESVVWIEPTDGPLYPPDLAAAGVDLDALVIVRVPTKEGPEGLCRVAEWLVRSGGFGLVIMDLVGRVPAAHNPWQTRLSGLLRKHDAQLCVLSDSQARAPSLGAMVALRLEPQRERTPDGSFVLSQRVLKNKLGTLQAPVPERRRAPAGLEALPALPLLEGSARDAQLSLFDTPELVTTPTPAEAVAQLSLWQPQASAPTLSQASEPASTLLHASEPAGAVVTSLASRRSVVPPPVVLRPKLAAKRVSATEALHAADAPAAAEGSAVEPSAEPVHSVAERSVGGPPPDPEGRS